MAHFLKERAIWLHVGAGGCLAVVFLFAAVLLELPGFNARDGGFGTAFMSSFLYAMHGDFLAWVAVLSVYFGYGAAIGRPQARRSPHLTPRAQTPSACKWPAQHLAR
ncbi:MAG: hypothetical protein HOI95_16215 [Chromatiales bacterium]|nr:hypothetical protein [Chromatiales bacterium]